MTIDVEHIASQVRLALNEAEERLVELREQRKVLNAEIKVQVEALAKMAKLAKAVTPKDQNGPDE